MDNPKKPWVPGPTRTDKILERHLRTINRDEFLRNELSKLKLTFHVARIEEMVKSRLERDWSLHTPSLLTNNLVEVLQKDPVTIIGICLIPKGRFQIKWAHNKKQVALDLYLAYRGIHPTGYKEIKAAPYQETLALLRSQVAPKLEVDIEGDPTFGRVIKYLHQLEQIHYLGLSEVHFILPNTLYANTLVENAELAGLSKSELKMITVFVDLYAARERRIILALMRYFFPELQDKLKVVLPTDTEYMEGLNSSSDFTQLMRTEYEKIPLQDRAMAYFAISRGYADSDVMATRLWLSDSKGYPVHNRSIVVLAHMRNLRPTGRFLLQSLALRDQVVNEVECASSSVATIFTTGGPSIFHRNPRERTLYWESERPNDDDYNAVPAQSLRLGDDVEGTRFKMQEGFIKEKNRNSNQSFIYLVLHAAYYYLANYCVDVRAKDLVEPLHDILSNWNVSGERNYVGGEKFIPLVIGFFRELAWSSLQA